MLNYKQIKTKINNNAELIIHLNHVYQEIAKRMLDRLNYIKINPKTILDIGSGLNIGTRFLKKKYPKSKIYELDIALSMLQLYSSQPNFLTKKLLGNRRLLCANAMQLPIANQTMDLVWSNLTLPFIDDLESYFNEIHRVLKIGGCFLVTGLGVDSLQQLRAAGLSTFNFPDMHLIGDILVKLGFTNPVTDIDYITLEYNDLNQLLYDMRLIGCGSAYKPNFVSKANYFNLVQLFKEMNRQGKLPLTLEIFYAHAWKDKEKLISSSEEKIIQFYPKPPIK